MTKKAAIYIRQSQSHEGTISPELQEKNVRRFIESQERWIPTEVYSDIDISGLKEENRPVCLTLR
jgi:site-specific DNA recombinase